MLLPFHVDPEMIETIKANGLERQNRYFRFIEELTPEDIVTFREIMSTAAAVENGREFLSHYIGTCDAVLRLKYPEVCSNCGTMECGHASLAEEQLKVQVERSAEENDAVMNEYNIMYTGIDTDGTGPKIVCKGCGVSVHSIEDRMLRDPGPEGCEGCKNKARWG